MEIFNGFCTSVSMVTWRLVSLLKTIYFACCETFNAPNADVVKKV